MPKQIYPQVTVGMLSNIPNNATIDNSLVLNDNIDTPIVMEQADKDIHMNTPMQYVSTMYLMACVEGTIDFNISLKKYHLKAGDVLFMKSGVVIELVGISDDCKFFNIILSEKYYFPIFNNIDMSVLQRSLVQTPIVSISEQSLNECIHVYRYIKQHIQLEQSAIYQTQIIQGYLQAIFFHIFGYYEQHAKEQPADKKPKVSRQQELCNRFMELLQRDFRREHNIKYYASELCVTPRYLSRIINEVSGHFASEHIDNFLITEAKQLIRSRQFTILQISEMLNFTSQSFFGRYFKNLTGYTPVQYQNLE